VRCRACGTESGPQAKFCSGCGAQLPGTCSSCGADVSSTARFCSQCGAPIPMAGGAAASLETHFAAMQRAMPASLREQLLTDAEGENRVLTILFADLTGSVRSTRELVPEDAAERVNDVLKAMVDAVLAYDGRINRLLGDAVLAFFGTPVAHENDPERAILAALRIRESVQRVGFEASRWLDSAASAKSIGHASMLTCRVSGRRAREWPEPTRRWPRVRSTMP
jgi:class 3 adenylate cyclase